MSILSRSNYSKTFELVGWSVERVLAGEQIGTEYCEEQYNGLCVTRDGKRWMLSDLCPELKIAAPPTYDPEGEPTEYWQPEEDVILLFPTFIGTSQSHDYCGKLDCDAQNVGLEDAFGLYWPDIAAVAWPLVDADPKYGGVSFVTLWEVETWVDPATWMGPAEWNEECKLLGMIDMNALPNALVKASADNP